MKLGYCFCFLFLHLCVPVVVLSELESSELSSTSSSDALPHTSAPLNINNFLIWTRYDGWSGRNPLTDERTKFPRGTASTLYQEGLIWGGYVTETASPELRVGGFNYRTGTIPGAILTPGVAEDSANPAVRVYRIRKDYATADLRLDASDLLGKPVSEVTGEDVDQIRAQYERDWEQWPTQKGAPFYDLNENGIREAGEEPGLLGADQVLWYTINDLDEPTTRAFYGSPPIGLEVQVTWWGYKPTSQVLANSVFMRYRLIYKGTAQSNASSKIEDMYISKWVDPDLGDFGDDYLGCDTTLSLGFVYNSSQIDREYTKFHMVPPSVGYVLLQGPIVQGGTGDKGFFDFRERERLRNLPMTSFIAKWSGSAISDPPYGSSGTNRMYNWIRGFVPDDNVIAPRMYADNNGTPTKFLLAGDPVTNTGWVDGILPAMPPGDRRFLLNTGPFTMVRGDTQEVVYALTGGIGSDYRQNVSILKYFVRLLRGSYPFPGILVTTGPDILPASSLPQDYRLSQNYPNPFNPSTKIEYAIPVEEDVRLAIYDVLGREIKVLEELRLPAGYYSVEWDGRDKVGREVASGIYFYKLRAGQIELTRKLMIIR